MSIYKENISYMFLYRFTGLKKNRNTHTQKIIIEVLRYADDGKRH